MTAPAQVAGPGTTTAYTAPVTTPQPTDVTRVLVVGHGDGRRVRWALTQVWRRAGRPVAVSGRGGLAVVVEAMHWCWAHDVHGVRYVPIIGSHDGPLDVLVVFGSVASLSAPLRAALPLARRAGLVVDGDTVGEFR